MAVIHPEVVGDRAMLPKEELDLLVNLAGKSQPITLQYEEGELPVDVMMKLADQGGALDWLREDEDLYTLDDLKVRYH